VPVPARDHPLQRELCAEDHAVEIDVDHPPGRQVVLVNEPADLHDPGVVYQHIHRAQLGFGVVQEPCERLALGHVQAQGDRRRPQLGGGLLRRLDVEVADRHAHAGSGQRLGRGAPDPARRPGDRGGLAGQDALTFGH